MKNKTECAASIHEDELLEDANHIFVKCLRWNEVRRILENRLDQLNVENLAKQFLP